MRVNGFGFGLFVGKHKKIAAKQQGGEGRGMFTRA